MGAPRSKRLKSLLASTQRTSDGTQKALLQAEDVHNQLEERENQRAGRQATASELIKRMPAAGGQS